MNKNAENERSLKVVHFALQFGSLSTVVLLYFFCSVQKTISVDLDALLIVGFIVGLIAVVGSHVLFKQKVAEMDSLPDEQPGMLRAAYVSRWALLQGAIIVSSIIFFMNGNQVHLFIALFAFTFLMSAKPVDIQPSKGS